MQKNSLQEFRNVAIIAHVDHGKTTLVDAMLKYSKIFRENQSVGTLIMDSDPQERERGITILSKNTAIVYGNVKINIIDTPGHVDFSGEVERVLNMADGCLLVVDALDGPMPQTRYVLKTALENRLKPIVIINKIDRDNSNINNVINDIQDLFLELALDADQLDFPIIYASAKDGYSVENLSDTPKDMSPLFETILDSIPPPRNEYSGPFQMLVAALDYDNHIGQIAIGRVFRGQVNKGDWISVIDYKNEIKNYRAEHLFSFRDLARNDVDQVSAGDIGAISGLSDVRIGDTIASVEKPEPLERIHIEDPTVKVTIGVNTSPFSGREGAYASSRVLWERLQRELQINVGLRVERTGSPDEFLVSGRGELHLSVLMENMRREGMEFQVSKPEAVTNIINDKVYEPYELLIIDTKEEFIGPLTEELSSRLAVMTEMGANTDGYLKIIYRLPTRGLIGFRNFFLRITRGQGIMNTQFDSYEVMKGQVKSNRSGVLVAAESGTSVTYAIRNAQERAQTFVEPQVQVYEGMIVGMHNRERDMDFNICKKRQVTNMRKSTSEIVERLEPAIIFSLEEALDFVESDELIEITPLNIRMRKRILDSSGRYKKARNDSRASR
ncbi:MAG: translational GTPase TypA [Chloroflexi bacterium]|nr:translational GTPase TypA [Chloroflexota bacterium]|tara:strand:- start:9826 stop:11664 length:1839 start_codon:yes stop_codon:yes gene_type:complete